MTMQFDMDITVIGAGVVGLAIASKVARQGRNVCVVEKNKTFGMETSSRNSEVIHAGIYYPQGSLKASMCIEGKEMLYELCQRIAIPYKRLGKLLIACDDKEIGQLEFLLENGRKNGLEDLKMLSAKEIKEIEPHIEARAAVLSPSTGIIDSHVLMKYYAEKADENGAIVSYNSEVTAIEKVSDGYNVAIKEPENSFSFRTRVLINSAGLYSDRVAALAGIDIIKTCYKLDFLKGEYFWVGNKKNTLVKRLIYPVPSDKSEGLGIHVTLDMCGRMKLGPNARYVGKIDYMVDHSQKKSFYESVVRFLPFIEYDDIEPDQSGIRPKLHAADGSFRDFIIRHEIDNGLPGFINLIGIESPGLTASPSIARYVAGIVDDIGI